MFEGSVKQPFRVRNIRRRSNPLHFSAFYRQSRQESFKGDELPRFGVEKGVWNSPALDFVRGY